MAVFLEEHRADDGLVAFQRVSLSGIHSKTVLSDIGKRLRLVVPE